MKQSVEVAKEHKRKIGSIRENKKRRDRGEERYTKIFILILIGQFV